MAVSDPQEAAMAALSGTETTVVPLRPQHFRQPRFREPTEARLRCWMLGTDYAMQPKRVALIVCTENLSPNVVVVQPAEKRV
jgi:hypothetical protein